MWCTRNHLSIIDQKKRGGVALAHGKNGNK